MADPFVAEIRIFPFNFAPKGWAFCDGQLLSLSQNTALFSLLGVTYGGDGESNFALPDLQGRAPMHPGQGPGMYPHGLGESGGSDTVTLIESEIPSHAHALNAQSNLANSKNPSSDKVLSRSSGGQVYGANTGTVGMAPGRISTTGGDAPHNNMMPYLTFHFCISLQGVYPPRG